MIKSLESVGFAVLAFPALILCARICTRQESESLADIIRQHIKDYNDNVTDEYYYNFRHWYTDGIMEVRISKL